MKQQKRKKQKTGKKRSSSLDRKIKPTHLSLEEWQVRLRQRFAIQQQFQLENIGTHPIFSEYRVSNPQSGNSYRVAIRGTDLGMNYCSCPDFSTNHLGTCKHIEWALHYLRQIPENRERLQEAFQPDYSEVYLHYGAQRTVRFQPGTECPYELVEASTRYFDHRGILKETAYEDVHQFLEQGLASEHEFRCYSDTEEFIQEVRESQQRTRLFDRLVEEQGIDLVCEGLLKEPLFPYQKEGVVFAARTGRCLLADEMGLGKTVQALATVELMMKHWNVNRVLIICPNSLKHQWDREIEKFTHRSVTVIEGTQPERERQYQLQSCFLIVNYDLVPRDLAQLQLWNADFIILDEAQRIRNWETQTAQAVKKIHASHCLVMTGTPLQNRLEDLVSIVQYIDRHRLGPIYRILHEHQTYDEQGKVNGYQHLDRIGKTLQPIFLRRTKKEVLDQLPERSVTELRLPLTSLQREIHEEQRQLLARLIASWSRNGHLTRTQQNLIFASMQKMRMVCNSSYLVDSTTNESVKPIELIHLLEELLEDSTMKVVIFSEWVRMIKLIQPQLEERNWKTLFLHGGVKNKQRKKLIEEFQNDPEQRIFLSTDSGGLGLNLQVASVVINLDLPWNPAVLEQRIARVHRLGQSKPVQVFNFISDGSFESSLLGMLATKRKLSKSILDFQESGRLGFDQDEEWEIDSFMQRVQHIEEELIRNRQEEERTEPPGPETESVSPHQKELFQHALDSSVSTASTIVQEEDALTPLLLSVLRERIREWSLELEEEVRLAEEWKLSSKESHRDQESEQHPLIDCDRIQLVQSEVKGEFVLKLPVEVHRNWEMLEHWLSSLDSVTDQQIQQDSISSRE